MLATSLEPPTETISTNCLEFLKTYFKVEDRLQQLKSKYPNFIKAVDLSKKYLVEVTYWKIQLPESILPTEERPDWEYVRTMVEGEIPIIVRVELRRNEKRSPHGDDLETLVKD